MIRPGNHNVHRFEVISRRVLRVLDRLDLFVRVKIPVRLRREIDQKKADKPGVPLIQPDRRERIEIDHSQLNVADPAFRKLCDVIFPRRFEPDREVEL